MNVGSRARCCAVVLLGTAASACNTFSRAGPDAPTPVPVPRMVSVVVEYRQGPSCGNVVPSTCNTSVLFYGSWMRPGNEFALEPQPGTFLWKGTAVDVPVNFPPRDEPYFVRVYDPYLRDTPSLGNTAARLRVGGQAMIYLDHVGTPLEAAFVFIDDNGQGRTPF